MEGFETYFSLAEIAQRIPKSDKFWRAELKRGAFAPALPNGQPDLSNVLQVGGEFFVPASGVAYYLAAHAAAAPVPVVASFMAGRARQPLPAPPRPAAGIRARSAGELRRKIDAGVVQTFGREVANHG